MFALVKVFLGSNGVLRWVGPLISGNPTSPRLSGKSQVRSGPMKMISAQEKARANARPNEDDLPERKA